MNEKLKPIIAMAVPICLLLLAAGFVFHNISNGIEEAKEFCQDKEGLINITEYDMPLFCSEVLNCSNRENPCMIKIGGEVEEVVW